MRMGHSSRVVVALVAGVVALASQTALAQGGRSSRASDREVRLANQGVRQLERLASSGVRQIESTPDATVRLLLRLQELGVDQARLDQIAEAGRQRVRRVALQRRKQIENFVEAVATRVTGQEIFNPRVEEGFVQFLREQGADESLVMLVAQAGDIALADIDNAEVDALVELEAAIAAVPPAMP
ncbi:MAG TPA: hypothetical protein DEB06_09640 [Phycisphaerales bacterium]|nr:hypothetical protein [Phycisphaerales bacterium]